MCVYPHIPIFLDCSGKTGQIREEYKWGKPSLDSNRQQALKSCNPDIMAQEQQTMESRNPDPVAQEQQPAVKNLLRPDSNGNVDRTNIIRGPKNGRRLAKSIRRRNAKKAAAAAGNISCHPYINDLP